MIVGFDIDGVILDFERVMRAYAELYDFLYLGKNGIINHHEFDYLKRYDWTDDERKYFIDNFLVASTLKTPLMAAIKEVLIILKELDIKVICITARGSLKLETKEAVLKRFSEEQLNVDDIIWGVKDKVKVLKEKNISLMVEDKPQTCKDLAASGIKVIYPRDKDNEIILLDNVIEVSNSIQILKEILKEFKISLTPNVSKKLLKCINKQ